MMKPIQEMVAVIKETLRGVGNLVVDTTLKPLAEEFTRILNELFGDQDVPQELPKNMKVYDVDVISKDKLVEIARECMVPNCNEVAAMKKNGKGYECIIYLAYSKDKELLPQEKNFYVIINAKESSKSVDELFGKTELIILN
jgi:hypothetical protein